MLPVTTNFSGDYVIAVVCDPESIKLHVSLWSFKNCWLVTSCAP